MISGRSKWQARVGPSARNAGHRFRSMPADRSTVECVRTSPTSHRCPVFPAKRRIRPTGPSPCGPSPMRSRPSCERRRNPAEQPWRSSAFDAGRPRLAFTQFSCAVSMRGRPCFTNARLASIRGPSIIRKRSSVVSPEQEFDLIVYQHILQISKRMPAYY